MQVHAYFPLMFLSQWGNEWSMCVFFEGMKYVFWINGSQHNLIPVEWTIIQFDIIYWLLQPDSHGIDFSKVFFAVNPLPTKKFCVYPWQWFPKYRSRLLGVSWRAGDTDVHLFVDLGRFFFCPSILGAAVDRSLRASRPRVINGLFLWVEIKNIL